MKPNSPIDKLSKMSPELLEVLAEQAKLMNTPKLQLLQERIDDLIEARDREFMAQTMTREQLLKLYNAYGYSPKTGDKFYKIRAIGRGRGFYGWQVGAYEHSCHVDTTDIIVLLIVEPGPNSKTYVEEYADLWLDGPIVV